MKKLVKLLFGTLLGCLVNSCSSQDLSTYTNIRDLESSNKNFEITYIHSYFHVKNDNNEEEVIAFYPGYLYKFNKQGNLIDTLQFPTVEYQTNIQPENYFIYTEDGYFPYWIKSGDKTFKKYDKIYNQDLTMDLVAIQKYEEGVRNFSKSENTDDFYTFLNKKEDDFEIIKLLKKLKLEATHYLILEGTVRCKQIIFIINNQVVNLNIPNELDYYITTIIREKEMQREIEKVMKGENEKPKVYETLKPFHFEKVEKVKRNWNILSTSHAGYWLGNAYYNLKMEKDTLKIKNERVSKDNDNRLRVYQGIFSNNKDFVLVESNNFLFFVKQRNE